uniref:Uncharacterized protein n=1 Tax=Chrysotila carterae TaxID=13221 RepID=A0A7S4F4E5_CHRCT
MAAPPSQPTLHEGLALQPPAWLKDSLDAWLKDGDAMFALLCSASIAVIPLLVLLLPSGDGSEKENVDSCRANGSDPKNVQAVDGDHSHKSHVGRKQTLAEVLMKMPDDNSMQPLRVREPAMLSVFSRGAPSSSLFGRMFDKARSLALVALYLVVVPLALFCLFHFSEADVQWAISTAVEKSVLNTAVELRDYVWNQLFWPFARAIEPYLMDRTFMFWLMLAVTASVVPLMLVCIPDYEADDEARGAAAKTTATRAAATPATRSATAAAEHGRPTTETAASQQPHKLSAPCGHEHAERKSTEKVA